MGNAAGLDFVHAFVVAGLQKDQVGEAIIIQGSVESR
jgi:hypothetical protein